MPIVTLIHLRPENTKAAPQAPLPCPAETRIEGGNKRRAGNGSGARAMPCRFKANRWAGYFDSDRLREKKLFDCPGSQRHNQQQSCRERKSTRLNSSHVAISYAVFCLKKKKSPHRRLQHEPEEREERGQPADRRTQRQQQR